MLPVKFTPQENSDPLAKPPHATWLREAVSVGFSAAVLFEIILGCAGLPAISFGFFPWVEMLALVVAAAAGIVAARGSWAIAQERFRAKNNLCLRCGYSLNALTSGVCPECGSSLHQSLPLDQRDTRPRRTPLGPWIAAICAVLSLLIMIAIKLTGALARGTGNLWLLLSLGLAIIGLVLGWGSRRRNSFDNVLGRFAIVVSSLALLGAAAWVWYLIAVLPVKEGAIT